MSEARPQPWDEQGPVESEQGPPPAPLPPGRHKLAREFVVASQRDRLLDAIAEACAEKGYGALSVADVVARARVSKSVFYEHFRDKEDCFLAAYDAILGQFMGDAIGAYQQPELGWAARVRAVIEVILSFMAAEPAFAKMCMVELLGAGPAALERYLSAVRVLATLLDEGRAEAPAREGIPASLAGALIGGAAVAIREQILAGRTDRLAELLPSILYTVLVPYLGQDEALRQARAAGPGLAVANEGAPTGPA
jgi:AcrR family transcriptional regulator